MEPGMRARWLTREGVEPFLWILRPFSWRMMLCGMSTRRWDSGRPVMFSKAVRVISERMTRLNHA